LRQRKKQDLKKRVLIIDASHEYKSGRSQNELLPEHVERICSWYHHYKDVEGVARVVTLADIAANENNLSIARYLEPKNERRLQTVDEAMKQLGDSAVAAHEAEDNLIAILKREGLIV
jgi:type I restriction enzyme M protein